MDTDRLARFLFVLYCASVGTVLVLISWSPGWDRMVLHLPPAASRLLGSPVLRGGLSGFGLVHLVWCLHDLALLFRSEFPDHDENRP